VPNEEQIRAWDGAAGAQWVKEAERYDRLNRGFIDPIVAAVDPQPGDHVIDVGCGNGALTLAMALLVAPDGAVTGVDISGPMLANATRRAEEAGLGNVTFLRADAQVEAFAPETADVVVSRFGVMFFDDPVAAFDNVAGALRPGGRMAFSCWQDLLVNEWIMVPAAAALEHVPMPDLGEPGGPGPFSLADPDRVRGLLTSAGLTDVDLREEVRPMVLGTGLDDALEFLRATDIAEALFADADEDAAALAWGSIRRALEPHTGPDGVVLTGRAWIASARRPT
jgi:SAM-dependent methyltransferase